MAAPVLSHILRQHAEQAAFLWTQYDEALQEPRSEDPEEAEAQAERLERLIERLEAHLDGLRVAGDDGLAMAEERLAEFREAGELFVVRMLQPAALDMHVRGLEVEKVRAYLAQSL